GTVPDIVEHCIEAVEKIGMDMEGIYRKSGPSSLTKQAVAELDRGQVPDLANEDIYGDATVATSVLKQYLRDLPNPLITFGVYPLVKQAMHLAEKDPEQGLDAMRKALAQLPAAHLATLDRLFAHLHRVVKAQDVTRMTPRNLGVVFGPTLIRD
ncbi:Rho GTPase activation protein, partial [Catenaria anguillulae PL171]